MCRLSLLLDLNFPSTLNVGLTEGRVITRKAIEVNIVI